LITSLRSWMQRHGWRDLVVPLVVYTLALIVITWPLAANLSTHVAGPETTDSLEYARLGWWANYAVRHGLNPFYQSLFGYPEGLFSATQASQPLIYWPIALLDFIFDPITSFNLWLLLEVILSGLTMYWLCREILGPDQYIPALFGGLVFVTFPTIQSHLNAGHINPLANYALPVLILAFYRIAEGRGGIRTALLGALALWILALSNFTFFVYALLPLVLFGGGYYLLTRRGQMLQRNTLRDFAVLFGVGLLLTLPFYLPLAAEINSPNRPSYLNDSGWVHYSSEPLNFIAFSPFTPWTRPIAPEFSWRSLSINPVEGAAYLGIVAVILAIIAIWRSRSKAGLWLTIALGCMLFSLGPLLKWGEQPVTYQIGPDQTHIVLPWAFFQNLPLINITRTPGRFNFMTGLALAMLAALGLSIVLQRLKSQQIRAIVLGALTLFMLIEYQFSFPFQITPTAVEPYFAELRDRTDTQAVFDVPWDDPLGQKAALNQQMVHQKPLLAGYVSRATTVDEAKLNVLSRVATNEAYILADSLQPLDPGSTRDVLRKNGADVLVYHFGTFKNKEKQKGQLMDWVRAMFGPPRQQSEWTAIFEVPPAEQPFHGAVLAYSHSGWWRQTPDAIPWITDSASLDVYASDPIDRRWQFSLSPLLHSRRLDLKVDKRLIRSWTVKTGSLEFWLKLEPGFHKIEFMMPEGCTPVPIAPACMLYDNASRDEQVCQLNQTPGQDDSRVCVSMALNSLQTQESGEMAFQPRSVRLFDATTEIDLRGFRLPAQAEAGQPLTVITDWLVPRKPGGDYHLFVHMLDTNGTLIAQADTIPGENGFPTTTWIANQTWSEGLTLTLPANINGAYSVYAGWYRYPELTRLQVDASTPRAVDGLVYLGDVEIR
jgi:hypothetical protein